MFARVELAVRPDLIDTGARETLRQIELTHPEIRKKIRWARFLEVYWFDASLSREEFIPLITELCWDRVSQWMFSGNLMPSAAGKTGSLIDLMEASPYRPGVFWGIERRFRSGIVDTRGAALLEAIEVMLGRPLPQSRVCSGGLLLLEGPGLDEEALSAVAKDVFAHELTQTWTLLPEDHFKRNDRFHQERVRFDLPRVPTRENTTLDQIPFSELEADELSSLLQSKKCVLSLSEIKKLKEYLSDPLVKKERSSRGLPQLTDVELAVISGVGQKLKAYPEKEFEGLIPTEMKSKILHSFREGSASLLFDEETAISLSVGVKPLSLSLEPQSAVQSAFLKSQYSILQSSPFNSRLSWSGGALLISDPSVESTPDSGALEGSFEERLHPRRVFQSATEGFQVASQALGIPHVNGAVWVGPEFESLPVYMAVSGAIAQIEHPEKQSEEFSEGSGASRQDLALSGDELFYLGSSLGKEGLQGQTVSVDLLTHKRMLEFLSDAQTHRFIRSRMSCSVGGLGASLAQLALQVGGLRVQLSALKTRQAGIRPYELLLSETQERFLVCVASSRKEEFLRFAQQRNVQAVMIGQVSSSQRLEMEWNQEKVSDLDPKFLFGDLFVQDRNYRDREKFEKKLPDVVQFVEGQERGSEGLGSFPDHFHSILLKLLSSPTIASKESIIRKCDHEAQGGSVVKPLHSHWSAGKVLSGPNDAAVIRPKGGSDQGLAIASGLNPKLMPLHAELMAQSALDECVRNLMCTGVEYSSSSSWMGLVTGWVWGSDSECFSHYTRACQGLSQAIEALGIPIVSTEVFWKENAFPSLYVGGIARVSDLKQFVQAQLRAPGDQIYVLGPAQLGLQASEFERLNPCSGTRLGQPDWKIAQRVYGWLGGEYGAHYSRLQSIHDVSDGGLLVAIAEGLMAQGLGVTLHFPEDRDPWEFGFGEGFHTFVVSLAQDDVSTVEQSWKDHQIPFLKVGSVERHERLDYWSPQENKILSSISVSQLRSAWTKEGYWE